MLKNRKSQRRQCQRRRNCVNLYIIRLVLMGQGCLNYFVVILDQKAVATNQTNAPLEKKYFLCITRKLMTSFFWLGFFKVLRIVEVNYWHIWISEEILSKKHVIFMQKYWTENLTFKTLSPSISVCKMTQKTCVARHVCDFYFIVTFCGLTLALTFCK